MDPIPNIYFNKKERLSPPTLLCPQCGELYLHQLSVEIIARDMQDGPATKMEIGWMGSLDIKGSRISPEEAPGRRDSLAIKFGCEHCLEIFQLQFKQHKGATYVQWLEQREPWSSCPEC